jgi:arylsulfatase A-like enzyme
MNRRAFLTSAAGAAFAAAPQRPPNILFLLTDDQRRDALGCMGNPIVKTPRIDGLAREGVRFTNMFVTTAICVSSRASIFSGLYTRCHGVEQFSQQFSAAQLEATYPAVLRKAGYRTGFVGKYGLDGAPLPEKGFDFWRGFAGQGESFPKGESGPHMLSIMTDQATEFLETSRASTQPFCLSVSYKHPHADDADPRQFLPDPRDAGLYRDITIPVPKTADVFYNRQLPLSVQRSEGRRRWAVRFSTPELYQESVKNYYRLCSGIDRSVGTLLDRLPDNTVVIYASDNGFYLAEHGLADKWFMHEESIRVPLIVHDPRPGGLRGRVVSQMALNIDLAPTILDLASVTNAPYMQGRSLTPLLRGEQPDDWRREFFYEHHFRYNGWIPATEGIRTTDWKYTRYIDEQPVFEELFDLGKDHLEERNLARDPVQRDRIQTLQARHRTWAAALEAWRPGTRWTDPK